MLQPVPPALFSSGTCCCMQLGFCVCVCTFACIYVVSLLFHVLSSPLHISYMKAGASSVFLIPVSSGPRTLPDTTLMCLKCPTNPYERRKGIEEGREGGREGKEAGRKGGEKERERKQLPPDPPLSLHPPPPQPSARAAQRRLELRKAAPFIASHLGCPVLLCHLLRPRWSLPPLLISQPIPSGNEQR